MRIAVIIGVIETLERLIKLRANAATDAEASGPHCGRFADNRQTATSRMSQLEFELHDIVTELCALDDEFRKVGKEVI